MEDKRIFGAFLLAIVLLLAVTAGLFLSTVRETTRPVEELSQTIGTQVAGILQRTPTVIPDPVTIIREVRSLARLETIEYSVEKVITAESGQGPFGFLFGDRLLLVAHGSVIAGVDLAVIDPEDLWLDDEGRLYLRLPAAEIFSASLDNQITYVYDREKGLLTRGDIDLESEARKAAEAEILRAAIEDGILEQAQVNAENFLFGFFRSLGYPDVIFEWEEPPELVSSGEAASPP